MMNDKKNVIKYKIKYIVNNYRNKSISRCSYIRINWSREVNFHSLLVLAVTIIFSAWRKSDGNEKNGFCV